MKLILEYEPRANSAAEHDIIYFGGEVSREAMTTNGIRIMEEELGWIYDESFSSWTFFT